MNDLILYALILYLLVMGKYIYGYIKSDYRIASGNNYFKTFFNKGNFGEFLTYRLIETLKFEKVILPNVYVPKGDETTEVDVVVVTQKGIFSLESKNYSGWIFGNEKNKMWTQSLNKKSKFKFFNPIWQNKAHIKALKEYLSDDYDGVFMNYVVFSVRCELKRVSSYSDNVRVFKRNRLKRVLRNDMKNLPNVLSFDEVIEIGKVLAQLTLVSDEVKEKHIRVIREKTNVLNT